jgi:hypothetical protein
MDAENAMVEGIGNSRFLAFARNDKFVLELMRRKEYGDYSAADHRRNYEAVGEL